MTCVPGAPHVIVVGGGPAGSTAAGLLAVRGWRVLLLDRSRFPRPKPCGECINPGGVALLRRLGLLEAVRALDPAPLEGWRVRTPASATAGATFGHDCDSGLGISRARFDHALLQAARRRGVRILEKRRVEELEVPARRMSGPRRGLATLHVREPDGRSRLYRAPVVVGADGLRSVTARSVDAHRRHPRLRKVSLTARLRGRGPMRDRGLLILDQGRVLGLAPVHSRRNLWNASVVVDAGTFGREVSKDPQAFLEDAVTQLVSSWRGAPELLKGPWASGPFDWPTERASAPGLVLVGDASGYYDPLTGQGIQRALRSAELAADAVDRALSEMERDARAAPPTFDGYTRALRREFRQERWVQKLVELVVSHEGLREAAIDRLAGAPGAMRALIRVTGNRVRPHTLLHPSAWAGLLTTWKSVEAPHQEAS